MYLDIESLLDEFYKTYYKIEEINLSQVIKCLTTTELHVIEAIGEESLTMNELSDRLGITMGTASVAVNKLTEKYFIERNRSDEDRRKVYVQLSKKGLLAYKYHVSFHSNILEKVTTDIKKEKLDTFVEVFQTIVHNLNKIKKDIQPESILNFEKGDIVQVSSIKGSPAIRKYLNEKGISIKSLIKILDINKHIIMLLVDGDEKIISIEDATDIMVTRNYV
ncbi:MAG: MarR family transcriptional regulator [Leptotrichiaceae bacterium]|nr:MarR family transcriptional regulator [Leptotrichiaceae bacterium]MBP7100700.1 MarR family transcriptional regulator [Leptotrichiaceae bacterium]MBP7739463.1 MarR family transcriptional regulator [Leptotrichiaceae bacterium]MBP9629780.1 MarR family transcriptional regulator [Leptotrichiaceae bacterium]